MNTFKFITNEALTVSEARRAVQQWAKRRAFPIDVMLVTETTVVVHLAAPDNGVHNRSVNALARILQKQLDSKYALVSRLNSTLI